MYVQCQAVLGYGHDIGLTSGHRMLLAQKEKRGKEKNGHFTNKNSQRFNKMCKWPTVFRVTRHECKCLI